MRIFGHHLPGTPDPHGENEQLNRRLDQLEREKDGRLKALRALQDEQYNLRSELSGAQRKLASLKAACSEAEAELKNLRAP
jgi:predicted  nucleic acid-binding Zn-ribbon protein